MGCASVAVAKQWTAGSAFDRSLENRRGLPAFAEAEKPDPGAETGGRSVHGRSGLVVRPPQRRRFAARAGANHRRQRVDGFEMGAEEERGGGVARRDLRRPAPEHATGVDAVVNFMNRGANPVGTPFDNSPGDAPHAPYPRSNPMMDIQRGEPRLTERRALEH